MIFLSLCLLVFLTLCHATCPNGSITSVLDPSVCYIYQSSMIKYMEAYTFCVKQGGNLVSIHSMFENVFISEEASDLFTDSATIDFWTGANTLTESGKWTWMDKTDFDFNDWDTGQPQNSSDNNCGAVKINEGKWIAEDCFKTKASVCSIKNLMLTSPGQPSMTTTKPLSCPSSWSYSNLTGYCYMNFGGTSWVDSLIFCRTLGAELASIHSLEETLFITNMVEIISGSRKSEQTWIGGFTDDLVGTCRENKTWNWTDGTPFDYGKLVYPCDGNGYCLFLWTGKNNTNKFGDFGCDTEMSNSVCKKLPS